ncbi:hypothetical protein BpHYR1_050780 [Brachionus plicatilis]|uniref:Uncharacterized protein n=1 Tax=Brachionus plicatilis TaxID=10195 RepID=A0A3M7PWX7_BRAPC|nr:hypothetical protein BpHYR1_050780 [Brachionus plicatilis]
MDRRNKSNNCEIQTQPDFGTYLIDTYLINTFISENEIFMRFFVKAHICEIQFKLNSIYSLKKQIFFYQKMTTVPSSSLILRNAKEISMQQKSNLNSKKKNSRDSSIT